MDGENEYLKNVRLDNQCRWCSEWGGGGDILKVLSNGNKKIAPLVMASLGAR